MEIQSNSMVSFCACHPSCSGHEYHVDSYEHCCISFVLLLGHMSAAVMATQSTVFSPPMHFKHRILSKEILFEKTCIHHQPCAILRICPLRSLYLSATAGKFLRTRSAIDSNEEPRPLNRLERTSSVIGTLPLIASKIAMMQFWNCATVA